ncbi:TetR family transcriptional regulator [Streptomyces sp. P17]|uniref:TetR/AcrR family transcriptional regulator n=1 Tax=Streptomyces sp. P17 TaxID=3074716 RepID=UPI0028F44DB0|nr:TetR family transcriptional regulator [Streptomyces sp. P17]MDT9699263.1 TetR family transcriptional regulator [Streptomyces sp. P17]
MGVVKPSRSRTPVEGGQSLGLRERKKAKTRAAIQQEALRLFREQGYEATTMEQIAEAAEVSQSTVFRYFPTKEELVVTDEQDAFFINAWRAQSPDLPVLRALRQAIRETIEGLSPEEFGAQRDRDVLMVTVPELWAASLGNVTQTMRMITSLVAERTGRPEDDTKVRAISGAIFGVILNTMLRWAHNPEHDVAEDLDGMLAILENARFDSVAPQ